MILFDLLKRIKLDFMVLFSSVSSVLTPGALSDYTAANSFLDAFAFFANAKGYFHALSINLVELERSGHVRRVADPAGRGGLESGCPRKRNHDKKRCGGLQSSPKFKSHSGRCQPTES
jgi:hypothetical protein